MFIFRLNIVKCTVPAQLLVLRGSNVDKALMMFQAIWTVYYHLYHLQVLILEQM